jgi:hypothetical protein
MQRSEKGESNPFYRMYRNKNRKISAETISVNIFLYFFQKLFKTITSAAPFASIPAEPESAW